MLLVKTSAVCLLLILYMIGFYYRKPHIPIRSTKIFQVLTGVAFLNALFDLITVYTVNHRDSVPEGINLTAHIIYLLSILGFIYVLFLYMRSYLEIKRKFSRFARICQSLPVFFSAVGILVLPITYVQGNETAYSLGPKAYALYGSLVVYLVLILYYCLRYWEIMDGEKRLAIVLAVPIYVIVSIVQMLLPEVLLVIVASTLIMLGLILSNENTEKYLDDKTGLFNLYSFESVLKEHDFERQRIIIGVLCFCKTENNFDWRQDTLVLRDMEKGIKACRLHGYRVCENGVALIAGSEEKARMVLSKVKSVVEEKYGSDSLSIETKVLTERESASRNDCMRNVIAFCTEMGSRFAYIDYMTHIYNRNALERDLGKLSGHESGCYIIADLNDLKIVNDTAGHSVGDKLLQGFAGMLAGAAGENGKAYRQGGDEFAVLYEKEAEMFVRELAQHCRIYNQSSSIPISYAIGCCELSNPDFINIADRMMYENKREMKQAKQSAAGSRFNL